VVAGEVPVILDVAHNAEACTILRRYLASQACRGRTLAVVGMLRDKPVEAIGAIMGDVVDEWHLGGFGDLPRGQDAGTLAARLAGVRAPRRVHATVGDAWREARRVAQPGDRIVVFGSFHTVEQLWEQVHG
jgi:dihydrofolate synthase/folylpolyglutamate synthase